MREFDDLVTEAAAVSVDGWDFSWLDGRATEERPSWHFFEALGYRMAGATASLDIDTGGGEVLAGLPTIPPLAAATESWPPNLAKATALLRPRGIVVVAGPEQPPLPFADATFDLITARHPVEPWWSEIARLLSPGGAYFAQHVGPHSVFELVEFFLGPQSESVRRGRHPDDDTVAAQAAGLEIADLRYEQTRIEFFDIGAVVYFLRKVIWMVPGFTVEAHLPKLRELDALIRADGPFVAYSTRYLVDARKPL
ncbi:methyltransferase family protein [Frondihabitans sp. PhB188]|uniref:methyltransferase domain-containing protein n=1 Tax=Frondihabitans sp. PhB188 TaxID=2485200 RepID=UPI000F4AE442|nr:methyltransferase domain-containing protein [Frondihabitans sp. PhB188]ROQ40098.1 methyltransferase family protein [Frondihabitans sp. PhB188]